MTSTEPASSVQLMSDTLPLPPIKVQLSSEADRLLVFSVRSQMRTAIERILSAMTNDGTIKVDKGQWYSIQQAFEDISEHGDPDDLFEIAMDFIFLSKTWIEAHWSAIEKTKDLRLLKEEQSRLEGFLHLLEQSPKRSRATIRVIEAFVAEAYKSSHKLSGASLTWGSEGSHPLMLGAYVSRIMRWKSESERLSDALKNDGAGLLPCCRQNVLEKTGKHVSSTTPTGSDEYDSDDILELRSYPVSESDNESDDEGDSSTVLQPPPGTTDPAVWDELNSLIGLKQVKRHLHEIIATRTGMPTLHLVLTGNPGVGKTTVARLYGRILKDLGVLSKGQLEEQTMSTLTGQFLGHSEKNTREAIKRAQGGVLFIDEAHQLGSTKNLSNDFGRKILDTLIPEMENLRSSFVVVFATYSSKLDDFFSLDPGLRRRVPEVIEFPDYSDSELAEILESMVARDGNYNLEPRLAQKVGRVVGKMRRTLEFANAGSVRNAYEKAQRRVNLRNHKRGTQDNVMKAKDFAFLEDLLKKAREIEC